MKKYFALYILLTVCGSSISQVGKVSNKRDSVVAKSVQSITATQVLQQHAKFVLTCNATNLTSTFQPVINYGVGPFYREVMIDHPLCNNNPNAFILVTPVRLKPLSYTLYYDGYTGKWKIKIETNGVTDTHTGLTNPNDGNAVMVTVLDYKSNFLSSGDKFNILIDNEK